ncbi:fibronectin type III domain-containing protein [Pseudomonas umsongensis]|uniref:fibronectin type III domain-containing protein n=1 Tax=Pseudomonas umsongensis TaxID=198618 RepID=UPI003ECE8241
MSLPAQTLEVQTSRSFLLPPTVTDTVDGTLNFNNLISPPIVSVAPWVGINSQSKLWMHCECIYANGRPCIIELAEAVPVSTSPDAQAFSCELPLDELSKLADNTTITIILMVSSDGTLEKQSLNSVRYSLMFQHPIILTNYSRWMTDIGSNLEHLKIHDLILLQAHNAGVDQVGAGWPADQWAACQDDSFTYQLRNGARALDLRLYRRSNATGTHQEFIFEHAGYDANRNLNHCIHGVLEFAEQNPGEIIILNFHEAVIDGREFYVDSIIEIALGNRCIPPTAMDLTIGQIRSRFPGRNIIITWNHSQWYCWPNVHQTWTGEDLNGERDLYNHITHIMADPPKDQLWSIFAAGYNLLGPIRFGPSAIHWDCFFNRLGSDRYRQPSKGNMINVDFFAGTGVVDRCINATRTRANQANRSRPIGLTTSNITTDSIHLNWARPLDNETIKHYALSVNDELVGLENSLQYTFKRLKDGVTYRLQVLAVFNSGHGAAAEITARTVGIPDTIKPTPPTDLYFVFFSEVNLARLQWTASTDNVAVIGYQVYRDGLPFGQIVQQTSTLIEVVTNQSYKVRALDAAGNFADSASLTVTADRIPPSKPTNLRAPTITVNSVSLEWYPSSDNVAVIGYRIYRNGTPISPLIAGTRYTDHGLAEATHYIYKVRALDAGGNIADSDPLPVTTPDETAPSKPTNLEIITHTGKSALLWHPSTDNVKVIGYEVYRNERLLDKTVGPLLFPIDVTEPYSFMVRALDAAGNHADSDVLASKDGPTNLKFQRSSDSAGALTWEPPIKSDGVTGYQLSLDRRILGELPDTHYLFFNLTPGTHYFEVRAIRNGRYSNPASISG